MSGRVVASQDGGTESGLTWTPQQVTREAEGDEQYVPVFMPVQDRRRDAVDVCVCADEEEDDQEEGLEVEDRCLFRKNETGGGC